MYARFSRFVEKTKTKNQNKNSNLLSVNWTIQFLGDPGRIIARVPRSSLSLSLGLARGFIGFRGRAAPSFFQVAARSREVASSSIIRLRPSHLTNVSVRFHIAASFLVPSPWILDSSRISHSYTLSLFLSLESGKDDVQACVQTIFRSLSFLDS